MVRRRVRAIAGCDGGLENNPCGATRTHHGLRFSQSGGCQSHGGRTSQRAMPCLLSPGTPRHAGVSGPRGRGGLEHEIMSPSSATSATGEQAFCAIGVDVGGTKIAAGLVTFPSGKLSARRQIPTTPQRGGTTVFTDVLHLCEGR